MYNGYVHIKSIERDDSRMEADCGITGYFILCDIYPLNTTGCKEGVVGALRDGDPSRIIPLW